MNALENAGSSHFSYAFLAVLVLVDVSDHWTRDSLSREVLKCLSKFPQIPSILVLNKVNEKLALPTFYSKLLCYLQAVTAASSDEVLSLETGCC